MNLNGHKLYIKIVDLDEIYNFIVQTFLFGAILVLKYSTQISDLKFKFWSEHWTPHLQKIIINLYELL